MKKLLLTITAIVLFAAIFISCTSTSRCAAYGEKQRYQMERHWSVFAINFLS